MVALTALFLRLYYVFSQFIHAYLWLIFHSVIFGFILLLLCFSNLSIKRKSGCLREKDGRTYLNNNHNRQIQGQWVGGVGGWSVVCLYCITKPTKSRNSCFIQRTLKHNKQDRIIKFKVNFMEKWHMFLLTQAIIIRSP